MEWLGTITAGTNDIPLAEQADVLKSAYDAGAAL